MAGAQLLTTGPAGFYVGFNSGQTGSSPGQLATPVWLGTSERAPRIRIYHTYKDIFNDIGGRKVPFDKQWQGDYAVITAVLNRFDYAIYNELATIIQGNSTPGAQAPNVLGSILGQEGLYQQLYVKFPYQALSAFAALPPGYRFPGASFEGPDDFVIGLEDQKIAVMWVANRVYNNSNQSMLLYDFQMGGVPNPT
jgi:hypothetical protein